MKQFANDSKWSAVYISLNNQAKNNEQIIFSKIPDNVSEEEIQDVLKELCFLSNFKNYSISRNSQNIKGIKKYV